MSRPHYYPKDKLTGSLTIKHGDLILFDSASVDRLENVVYATTGSGCFADPVLLQGVGRAIADYREYLETGK